ncbi:hypothetical protein IRJ41_013936 [Triplophysa rosa]|uniref:Uncharacterized protein n=1 Tax=Triplophysa rosa TaxID=992332 RepID=A0A9W7X0V4_TRIRA|nr:hypothetical protein IRJ41_013936 [Triplophysa rosa]
MTARQLNSQALTHRLRLSKLDQSEGASLYPPSGGGQRKLIVIPPDPDGYNGQQLKAVSSNGKCTMYIVPLQEQIDTTPLPPDAKEFEKMPKAQCTMCSQMVPLQCLPMHIKSCEMKQVYLCTSSDYELEKSPEFESCDSYINEVWTEKNSRIS